jgi:formate hydrogenlyase subunit 3/multisubunit Na+/H+ antiporter MnhD subunit
LSELVILRAALDQGHPWIAAAFLALLAVIFVGVSKVILEMAQGMPPEGGSGPARREPASAVGPAIVFAAGVLVLGVWIPPSMRSALERAAQAVSRG